MLIAEHSPRSGAPVNLGQAKAVIIVFVMEGCGACRTSLPQFQAVAKEFAGRVPAFSSTSIVSKDTRSPINSR